MVMPIGDDDSRLRTTPVVTTALLLVNIVVFGFELVSMAEGQIETLFMRWSVIPLEYARGADLPPTHPGPYWATLISSMFMHAGWAHLFGNMLFLWIFGDNVEDAMGHARFLVFYLVCGVAAAVAQIALNAGSPIPSLGASGAISGVLGAYLLLFPRQRVRVFIWPYLVSYLPAIVVIGMWIVIQFISGVGQIAQAEQTGGVAYGAHVGGFLAGFVLVSFFRRRRARS